MIDQSISAALVDLVHPSERATDVLLENEELAAGFKKWYLLVLTKGNNVLVVGISWQHISYLWQILCFHPEILRRSLAAACRAGNPTLLQQQEHQQLLPMCVPGVPWRRSWLPGGVCVHCACKPPWFQLCHSLRSLLSLNNGCSSCSSPWDKGILYFVEN